MNKYGVVLLVALFVTLCIGYGISYSADRPEAKQKVMQRLFKEVPLKDGVKEITYEQFQKIRNLGAA